MLPGGVAAVGECVVRRFRWVGDTVAIVRKIVNLSELANVKMAILISANLIQEVRRLLVG